MKKKMTRATLTPPSSLFTCMLSEVILLADRLTNTCCRVYRADMWFTQFICQLPSRCSLVSNQTNCHWQECQIDPAQDVTIRNIN